MSEWDNYFYDICRTISSKSPCLSRQLGAILVRDKSIISTGYNGPPRGIPHCGDQRYMKDDILSEEIHKHNPTIPHYEIDSYCPRRLLGCKSGEDMQWCPAQHAEENCISNAARNGVSTIGSTLYMNGPIPCKNCFSTLINAGIVEIVVEKKTLYDRYSIFIIDNSNIKIREFEL